MKEYPKIVLKSGKDQSLYRYHPWVFSGAIKKIHGVVNEGDIVKVYNNKDEFLAMGHYQVGTIAVRVFSFSETEPDELFWLSKIKQAWDFRKQLNLFKQEETNVFRLINAEGDGMPGLIVDYYNGTAVMQMHSIGMYLIKDILIQGIKDILGESLQAIYDKSEATLPFKAKIKPENGLVYGSPTTKEVLEYGNKFTIDWKDGQKTGFFIDQRENRRLLIDYCSNKSVLNMFGYTGGFSVYALEGDAIEVHTVDSSRNAIKQANRNIELNFSKSGKHKSFCVDAFEFLNNCKDQYDLIILDPPAFAKHNNVLHNALQGYKRLNSKAIEQIKPGGIIFTFSCSQVVSKDNFRKSVFTAAANTGRKVRVLHQLTQPADHPVSIYHPEGEYLKGLVLQVE